MARRPPDRAARAAVVALPRGFSLPRGRTVLVAIAVVAVCALAFALARGSSLFAVRAIEVRGASPATAARIRVALEPLLGRNLLTVGRGSVVAPLEALPEVSGVSYDRAFPHTVRVTVRTERPVAVLRQGVHSWLVVAGGKVVRAVARRGQPALPRIWVPGRVAVELGATPADSAVRDAVAAAAAVAGTRVAGERARTVAVTPAGVVYGLRSGLEIRLGDLDDIRLKLAIARRIVAAGGVAGYVDVSVPERPVAGTNPQVEG